MEPDDVFNVDAFADAIEAFNGVFIRLPSLQKHSFTTLSVLHTLASTSPLRLTELTATEQVTQSAITQLVTRLERDGLVVRQPDPRDGRAVLVHITPAGRQIVADRRADRVAKLAPLIDQLTAEQRQSLRAVMPALHRIGEFGRRQPKSD